MVYNSLIERLLPGASCLLCGAPRPARVNLCEPCAVELPWLGPSCPRCAMPLPAAAAPLCAHCLQDPPPFSACVAAFRYEFPVREVLARFKFDGDLAAGRLLAEQLALRLRVDADAGAERAGFTLVPVPLHPARLAGRGFNQAERIARVLARRLGLPLEQGLLRRLRQTPDQKRLSAAERHANLRGAFSALPCAGRRIALVDDVVTTGTTARLITHELLAAGAAEVRIWCAARAI